MKKTKWEYPGCNLCGAKAFTVVWDNVTTWEHEGKFRIVCCKECRLIYLNPRPTSEYIENFYLKEGYWGRDLGRSDLQSNWKEERQWRYGPLYREIFKRKNKGSIIDIGAGTGMFLTRFKERGWKVQGTEVSEDVAKFGKENFGIRSKVGDFLKLKFDAKQFDVVTLNTVLEHVYKPKETLKKVYRILKSDGLLVVTVPNIDSFGSKIFRSEWYALDPPRHLYHFSTGTLKKMIEQADFEIQDIYHDYWAHNYYHLFESLRFLLSPRFKKKKRGGIVKSAEAVRGSFSIAKEAGKLFGRSFAAFLAKFEPFLKRGEVFTVYACKK